MTTPTFQSLYSMALTYLDKPNDTGQGLSMVKAAIQLAHERRLSQDRWSFMLFPTYQFFNFVLGQRRYILDYRAQFITDFMDLTAGQVMKETPSRARYNVGVQEDQWHYEFIANSPVSKQPTPTTPKIVTVAGSALITYVNSVGDIVQEVVTNANSQGSVAEIVHFVNNNINNVVTLADFNGVVLQTLGVGETERQYPQINLFNPPQNTDQLQYRFYRKPSNLLLDNDIPDIPYPYSRVLVYDALLELDTYNDSPAHDYWLRQQSILDLQMRQAYQEGEMEGSETRQIQEVNTFGG